VNAFRAKIVSLLTVVAVVLVSDTCTSAGCLLQVKTATAASAFPVSACCAVHLTHIGDHGPGHSSDHRSDHRCPLCQHTLVLAKAIDHSRHDFKLTILPWAFCDLPAVAPAASPTYCSFCARGGPPPGEPRTLVDLHCALLI
jgi:hypothetical protein